jgi:hypothetical protein
MYEPSLLKSKAAPNSLKNLFSQVSSMQQQQKLIHRTPIQESLHNSGESPMAGNQRSMSNSYVQAMRALQDKIRKIENERTHQHLKTVTRSSHE